MDNKKLQTILAQYVAHEITYEEFWGQLTEEEKASLGQLCLDTCELLFTIARKMVDYVYKTHKIQPKTGECNHCGLNEKGPLVVKSFGNPINFKMLHDALCTHIYKELG